jgi:N-acetylglucosaminyl-diphospho-decaprenol L-rhamnosyltransferase
MAPNMNWVQPVAPSPRLRNDRSTDATVTDPVLLTIVLNYKTAEMTERAVEAALREMDGLDGEVLIVDNDSQDGSFEALSQAVIRRGWDDANRVRVIQTGHNGGYGSGNNAGIRAGLSDGRRPDFVYILNSDAFPDKDAIRNLLRVMDDDPRVGFAGSYIHGPDGTPHETSFRFPTILGEVEMYAKTGPISKLLKRSIIAMPIPDRTVEMDWVCGASLLIRTDMLDAVGLFDETFFLYYEETDLCRRVWDAGWKVMYVRDSEVTHIGSVSTGMKEWTRIPGFWLDSRLYYYAKNHGRLYAAGSTLAIILGFSIYELRRILQRRPPATPPRFLRDLIAHDVTAAWRGLTARARPVPATAKKSRPDIETT